MAAQATNILSIFKHNSQTITMAPAATFCPIFQARNLNGSTHFRIGLVVSWNVSLLGLPGFFNLKMGPVLRSILQALKKCAQLVEHWTMTYKTQVQIPASSSCCH